jgi:hypothetical protein
MLKLRLEVSDWASALSGISGQRVSVSTDSIVRIFILYLSVKKQSSLLRKYRTACEHSVKHRQMLVRSVKKLFVDLGKYLCQADLGSI